MLTLILIGLVGGLITGISPCILPVLPAVFFAASVRRPPTTAPTPAKEPALVGGGAPDVVEAGEPEKPRMNLRPYKVIAGLVLSFTVFTLLGSLLIDALHLPNNILRVVGLVVLVAVGLGLIFPRLEGLLERPFSRIPMKHFGADRGAFALGLGLGLLYVPCAGPVLAAITVAAATGQIGAETVALTISFSIGAATPLLLFALAGARVADRIKAFRTRARTVRIIAGIVMIALAGALVLDLPAIAQRALPDYTSSLQKKVEGNPALRPPLSPLTDGTNEALAKCPSGDATLRDCGAAPPIEATNWLNTPGNAPIDITSLRGKVTIVDFWTYSCINCQRDVPRVQAWYAAYQAAGLRVIGVHTPEFVFERDLGNIRDGADKLGITYPIAVDNKHATWNNYRNQYWPALYLVDATGTVRHIHFGEGNYQQTEKLIRGLLTDANPNVDLPSAINRGDDQLTDDRTPETYLDYVKLTGRSASGRLADKTPATYQLPAKLPDDKVGLAGTWTVGDEAATAGTGAQLAINYRAKDVHLVLAGTGTITYSDGRTSRTIDITGAPRLYDLIDNDKARRATLTITVSPGVQAYSFTFG